MIDTGIKTRMLFHIKSLFTEEKKLEMAMASIFLKILKDYYMGDDFQELKGVMNCPEWTSR